MRAWVDLWERCRAWGVLPRGGGLDAQQAIELEALQCCDRTAAEYRAWRRSPRELTGEESVSHLRQMMRIMGGRDRRRG